MSSLTDRRFTDSAQRIVQQLTQRAGDRGLFHFDDSSVIPLALWTLIRWERKVGFAVLEMLGVDLHSLADKLDALLTRLADKHPVVAKDGIAVYAKTGKPVLFDLCTATEPLLAQGQLANSWVNGVGCGCWPRSVGGPRDVRQARSAAAVVRWILEPPCAPRLFPTRLRPTTGTLEGD